MFQFMYWLAVDKQQEFFNSLNSEFSDPVDGKKLLAIVFTVLAVIVLMIALSMREKKPKKVGPKTVRHQGRLLKEIAKSVGIRSRDMKKLKAVAAQQNVSPLTLLLCPSALPASVRKKARGK